MDNTIKIEWTLNSRSTIEFHGSSYATIQENHLRLRKNIYYWQDFLKYTFDDFSARGVSEHYKVNKTI